MKSIIALIITCFVSCAATSHAQTLTGKVLNVSPDGSNNIYTYGSWYGGAAIGRFNYIWSVQGKSLAVGNSNTIQSDGTGVFGSGNDVMTGNSLVVGQSNNLFVSWEEGGGDTLLAAGEYIFVDNTVRASIVAGQNNSVGSGEYPLFIEATATFGRGLYNRWNHATVVGHYNDTSWSSVLFAVGNGGPGANERSDALVVLANGDIVIPKPQGDIAMGEFGN